MIIPRSAPVKSMRDLHKLAPDLISTSPTSSQDSIRIPPTKRVPKPHGQKVIVCHDFAGGYNDDALDQGQYSATPMSNAYSFQHWPLIDIFIYFSHERIATPPLSWINCAHTSGVKILGTFITEWDLGISENGELLSHIRLYADLLVQLAVKQGFDGWFFNFEAVFPSGSDMHDLAAFLAYLTREIHDKIDGGLVIVYDSLTCDNEIKWQDCLNDKNRFLFDCCDGLFTNYTWTPHKLAVSVECAGNERRYDVYTGIDIWGRNTFGGGGFDTCKALVEIAKRQTSVALFAPAWTFEALGAVDFLANDAKLWYGTDVGLANYLSECRYSGYFQTSFNRGFGYDGFFLEGDKILDGTWHDISMQSILPNPARARQFVEMGSRVPVPSFEWSLTQKWAYNGSHCLQISRLSDVGTGLYVNRLFDVDVSMNERLKVECVSQQLMGIGIALFLDMADDAVPTGYNIRKYGNEYVMPLFVRGSKTYVGWRYRSFNHIPVLPKARISGIGILVKSVGYYGVPGYIGHLSIQPYEHQRFKLATEIACNQREVTWKRPVLPVGDAHVRHCFIFADDKCIGVSHTSRYVHDSEIPADAKITIKCQFS